MRTLVVIPCGKQKIWDRQPWRGAVMARDAYTSSLFRLSRRYAERSGDRWVIVSAKYGFLNPTDPIPGPYNVSFLNHATHPIDSETLQSQYRELGLDQYERCIALGGLVPVPYRTALPWLVRCFKKARPDQTQSPLAVYHGFGVSSWETLLHFPFYSVDSSSWTGGFRFGSFSVFNDRTGKWLKVGVGQRKQAYAIAPLLRSYGVDPADLADRSRYHSKKIAPAAVLSWVRAEQYLRRRHGPIHIPERPPTSGQEDILSTTPHSVMHLTDAGVLKQPGAPPDPAGQKLYLSPGMDPDKGLVGVSKQLGETGPAVHLALAGTTDDHRIQAADAGLKGYLTTGHAMGASHYQAGQEGLKTYLANGREGRLEHAILSVAQKTSPGLHAHRACGGYVQGSCQHELHKGQ